MPTPSKRLITAQDLYGIQQISGARIAPDGRHIAYAVQRVEQKTEKKYSNLWIVATDGSSPARQFTYGDQNDAHPRWSPDGQWIAFLSNRGDRDKPAQIYVLPFFGGEARPLMPYCGPHRHLRLVAGRHAPADAGAQDGRRSPGTRAGRAKEKAGRGRPPYAAPVLQTGRLRLPAQGAPAPLDGGDAGRRMPPADRSPRV